MTTRITFVFTIAMQLKYIAVTIESVIVYPLLTFISTKDALRLSTPMYTKVHIITLECTQSRKVFRRTPNRMVNVECGQHCYF